MSRIRVFAIYSILVAATLVFAASIAKANQSETPREWDGHVPPDELRRIDHGATVSDMLFNMIDEITLFDQGSRFYTRLEIERDIFRNPGEPVTWTVVDRFYIRNGANLNWGLSNDFEGNLGLYVGSHVGLKFTNVHQLTPAEYEELPSVDEMESYINSQDWFRELQGQRPESFDPVRNLQFIEPTVEKGSRWAKLCPFPEDDLENRSKFCNILSRITFPFRYPVRSEDLKHLENNEMISFNLSGHLGFGLAANWSVIPNDILGLIRLGARVGVYLKGHYEIIVHKEDSRYARVKVVEADERGRSGSVWSKIGPRFLEGIFLVEKLDGQIEIVPFRYKVNVGQAQIFENGFRYDLTKPQAREAFDRAVRGDLSLSGFMAVDDEGELRPLNDTGVERLFSIRSEAWYKEEESKVKIAFAFQRDNDSYFKNIEATFETPEGEVKTFKSIAENKTTQKLLAWLERFWYRFSVMANLDNLDKNENPEGMMRMLVEGSIEDTRAFSDEMLGYILEVEDSVGQFGSFFRPPRQVGGYSEGRIRPLPGGHNGPVRYYFSFEVQPELVHQFITTPEAQRWRALEHAFNVDSGEWETAEKRFWYKLIRAPLAILNAPLYLAGATLREGSDIYHAERMEDLWAQVVHQDNLKDKAATFGRMFYDRFYSYELVRILRSILEENDVYARYMGSTLLKGVEHYSGDTVLRKENIATRKQAEMDKKHEDKDGDPDSRVLDLHSEALGRGQVKISFVLNKAPVALHFSVRAKGEGMSKDHTADIIVHNEMERFKPGLNTLIIDAGDESNPWYSLAKRFRDGVKYKLRVAVNADGRTWGSHYKTKFYFIE